MKIGEIIDNYLKENGMSQRQFAKNCGMSNGYISMLIKGKNSCTDKPMIPSLSALLAISKALGITLDQLLAKTDDIQVDISGIRNVGSFDHPADSRFSKEDSDLAFALWGDSSDIDEKDIEDVKRFAAFIREKKTNK